MKNIISPYSSMKLDKKDLKKLKKSDLIKLLLEQDKNSKPVPLPRTVKSKIPIPTPRKSVKQMVHNYENNIILPPHEFRDKPVPAPRIKKPVPLPRTKIEQIDKALKGYTKSYEISIKNNKDPLIQLQNTRKAIEHHITSVLKSMKGLKFVETVKVTFKKYLMEKPFIR